MREFWLLDEEGMGSNIKLCNDQERKAKLFRVPHVQEANHGVIYCILWGSLCPGVHYELDHLIW